jgi:hypothetical protein
MRPNFTMWSDYGAPAQRQWMSTSKRGAGSSIGPKILLAAVVVVAGVIGISGIYPQVIDAEWMQDNGTHLPVLSLPTNAATKPSTTATAFALRGRHAVTTGQAVVASQLRPAAPAAPAVPPPRTSVAAVAPPPPIVQTPALTLAPAAAVTAPPVLAEIPDAEAKAEAPATESSPPKVVERQTRVVKRRVAQRHQRSFAGAYAQYGGWGWGGWSGFGGGYRRY